MVILKYEYTYLYLVYVQFLGEIALFKVNYSHNIHVWIWIIAVNHLKTSTFNKTFEFSTIFWYYSYAWFHQHDSLSPVS